MRQEDSWECLVVYIACIGVGRIARRHGTANIVARAMIQQLFSKPLLRKTYRLALFFWVAGFFQRYQFVANVPYIFPIC
jgi:hypothetical protein